MDPKKTTPHLIFRLNLNTAQILQVTGNTDHLAYVPQTANFKVLYSQVVGV